MKDTPHVSLEQWRALIAVVEAGGYAQAADKLHKSQSAIELRVGVGGATCAASQEVSVVGGAW